MPRPPGHVGKRLLPDPEIASGWYNSVGKEKLREKERRPVSRAKTPKRGKLFKLELDFNQAAAILPTEPIYSFGWNSSGQLALGHTLDKANPHSPLAVLNGPSQYEPTRTKSIALVACGARHTAIATADGNVYLAGRTAVGQLGLAGRKAFDTQGYLPAPMKLGDLAAVGQSGSGHDGADGTGATDATDVTGRERERERVVCDVAFLVCGASHTLVCRRPRRRSRSSGSLSRGGGSEHKHGACSSSDDGSGEGEGDGSDDDQLYSFGFNQDGQLGIGNAEQQDTPVRVNLRRALQSAPAASAQVHHGLRQRVRLAQVACGGTHSAAVVDGGVAMFVWGGNRAGQLGLGDRRSRSEPTLLAPLRTWHVIDSIAGGTDNPGIVAEAMAAAAAAAAEEETEDSTGASLPPLRITALGCGKDHTLVATAPRACGGAGAGTGAGAGEGGGEGAERRGERACLWAFGSNCDGQLGLGDLIARVTPTRVAVAAQLHPPGAVGLEVATAEAEADVARCEAAEWDAKVAAAEQALGDMSAAHAEFKGIEELEDLRTRAGGARDEASRLHALSREKEAAWAALRAAPHEFTHAVGGESHSAVGLGGRVFVCGGNRNGQLGMGEGDFAPRRTPTLLPSMEVGAWPVRQLQCGRSHTVCLNIANECYCWGANQFGQLGCGSTSAEGVPEPQFQPDLLWSDDRLELASMQHACHTMLYRRMPAVTHEELLEIEAELAARGVEDDEQWVA